HVCAILHGHRDQPLAVDRSTSLHARSGGLLTEHAGLPAGRHAVPAADHPCLFKLVVLGVPRKGARRRGLSLKSARCPLVRAERTCRNGLEMSPYDPGGHEGLAVWLRQREQGRAAQRTETLARIADEVLEN